MSESQVPGAAVYCEPCHGWYTPAVPAKVCPLVHAEGEHCHYGSTQVPAPTTEGPRFRDGVQPPPARIQVTVADLDSGESETAVISDNYVLTCAGSCYLAHTQSFANGTVVLTVKGRRRS